MQQALQFSLVAAPWVHARLGSARVLLLLGVACAIAYAVAFIMQAPNAAAKAAHVACMLVGGVANGALEVVVTAIASAYVPPSAQGRLFAALAMVRYGGAITGNLAGTYLFQYSLNSDGPLVGGGALPLVLLAPPVLLNTAALGCCALTPSPRESSSARKGSKVDERGATTDDELLL